MPTHAFTVEVKAANTHQAATVMAERLNHEEDYGFPYSLDWNHAEDPDAALASIRLAARKLPYSADVTVWSAIENMASLSDVAEFLRLFGNVLQRIADENDAQSKELVQRKREDAALGRILGRILPTE